MGNCLAQEQKPERVHHPANNGGGGGESPSTPAVVIVLPVRLRATLDRQIIVAESNVRRMINILDHGGPKSTQRRQQHYLWRELTDALRDAIVVISRVYVDFRLERLQPQKRPSLPPPPPLLSHDFLGDLDLVDRFFVVGRSALGPGSPELDPDQAPGQPARHRPEVIEVKRQLMIAVRRLIGSQLPAQGLHREVRYGLEEEILDLATRVIRCLPVLYIEVCRAIEEEVEAEANRRRFLCF